MRRCKKRVPSRAAPTIATPGVSTLRLGAQHELRDGLEHFRVERIVDPAPFLPVRHQPGELEGLEMEGEARLCRAHRPRQVADAALPTAQPPHDLETGLVRERVEPAGRLGGVEAGRRSHGDQYIKFRCYVKRCD